MIILVERNFGREFQGEVDVEEMKSVSRDSKIPRQEEVLVPHSSLVDIDTHI